MARRRRPERIRGSLRLKITVQNRSNDLSRGIPWAAGAAIVFGLFGVFFGIQRLPLLDPDEGRNAEVAREMLEARDWIVPRFQGLPYLDKPALYFDTVALSYVLFGQSEASSRLPSAVFAAGVAIATFSLGTRLLGRWKALAGTAVLVTAPLFVGFARVVIFDMPLTFFVLLAVFFSEEGRRGHSWGFPLCWVSTGLAVLVKGPIGLLLPILGTVALALGQGRPYRLRKYFHPLHIVLFFAVALPWVLAVEARNPGFLRYVFFVETFERLTRPTFHRTGSPFYYVPVLLLGFFPWSIAALASAPRWLRHARGLLRPSPERGLIFAAAAIVLFFSLSSSKLGGYVLPAFPLFALFLGAEAVHSVGRRWAWTWIPGFALLLIGLWLSVGASRNVILGRLHLSESLLGDAGTLLGRVGIVSLVTGALLLGLGIARRVTVGAIASIAEQGAGSRGPDFEGRAAAGSRLLAVMGRAPAALLVIAMWLPLTVAAGFGPVLRYADENSSRALAAELRKIGGNGVRVVAVHCLPTGIDYYMGRLVPVVTETGAEFTSTYVARNFPALERRAPDVWSDSELASRLAQREVDILITRGNTSPSAGCRLAGRWGGFSLWDRCGAPSKRSAGDGEIPADSVGVISLRAVPDSISSLGR
jgi:hypothetical protein